MVVEVTFEASGITGGYFDFPNAGYGQRDDNFRLTAREEGASSYIVYNKEALCCGFEIVLHGSHGHAYLGLPASVADITMFYEYIKYLCDQTGVKSFVRNQEEVATEYISAYIQNDIKESEILLRQVKQVLQEDNSQVFVVVGVNNPISLGQAEMERIDGNLEVFSTYLHNVQSEDVFFAGVQLYKTESGETLGIIVLSEECATALPDKPEVFNSDIVVDKWILRLFFANNEVEHTSYDRFIKAIDRRHRYDSSRFIVKLNREQMLQLTK